MCGSAVLMPWVESVSSTLVIWYPGVEGGAALADVTSTVVFVDAGLDESEHERQPRRLVGFSRIDVEAGGRTIAVIELDWSMLDLRMDGVWITEPGAYGVDIGFHANDPQAHHLTVERG